jgi:hypothetical protein
MRVNSRAEMLAPRSFGHLDDACSNRVLLGIADWSGRESRQRCRRNAGPSYARSRVVGTSVPRGNEGPTIVGALLAPRPPPEPIFLPSPVLALIKAQRRGAELLPRERPAPCSLSRCVRPDAAASPCNVVFSPLSLSTPNWIKRSYQPEASARAGLAGVAD